MHIATYNPDADVVLDRWPLFDLEDQLATLWHPQTWGRSIILHGISRRAGSAAEQREVVVRRSCSSIAALSAPERVYRNALIARAHSLRCLRPQSFLIALLAPLVPFHCNA